MHPTFLHGGCRLDPGVDRVGEQLPEVERPSVSETDCRFPWLYCGRLSCRMSNNLPANWNAGFNGDMRIGGDGSERPFLRNNRWFLRVFEVSTGTHYLYDYASDLFEVEA